LGSVGDVRDLHVLGNDGTDDAGVQRSLQSAAIHLQQRFVCVVCGVSLPPPPSIPRTRIPVCAIFHEDDVLGVGKSTYRP
jgi:hypothetical protein